MLYMETIQENVQKMKILLEQKADPNRTNTYGITPLFIASTKNIELVQLLVEHKADVNQMVLESGSPLSISCHFGHIGIAKYLIENNAMVNARRRSGMAAIWDACLENEYHCVKLLINSGAHINNGLISRCVKKNTMSTNLILSHFPHNVCPLSPTIHIAIRERFPINTISHLLRCFIVNHRDPSSFISYFINTLLEYKYWKLSIWLIQVMEHHFSRKALLFNLLPGNAKFTSCPMKHLPTYKWTQPKTDGGCLNLPVDLIHFVLKYV